LKFNGPLSVHGVVFDVFGLAALALRQRLQRRLARILRLRA
jgi:hypothetical protein